MYWGYGLVCNFGYSRNRLGLVRAELEGHAKQYMSIAIFKPEASVTFDAVLMNTIALLAKLWRRMQGKLAMWCLFRWNGRTKTCLKPEYDSVRGMSPCQSGDCPRT